MLASQPATSWPSARASAATPPMKVPQIPKIYNFMTPRGRPRRRRSRAEPRAAQRRSKNQPGRDPQQGGDQAAEKRDVEAVAQDVRVDHQLPDHDRERQQRKQRL